MWQAAAAAAAVAVAGPEVDVGAELAPTRAALCTCTGHGPDLACVEHGEALRRWREESGT